MSRKTARELAFKLVYEREFQKDEPIDELITRMLENLEEDETCAEQEEIYIREVVNGVFENLKEIDRQIEVHLKDWKIERICKTDIAILRLAIFEIMHRDDIPYKVSINEAVELAKLFGEDSSASFINGVLAEIVKEI